MRRTLGEAIKCDKTGRISSSRIIALVAGFSLSFSTILMAIGSFFRPEMVSAVVALGPTLGLVAGSGYVTNKITMMGQKNEA